MRCPPRRPLPLPPGAPRRRRPPSGTLTAETIALVNPQKNYAQFLLRALLPTIIHVVITLAAGYSVGSEFRRRDARAWLESAGGDPVVALAGKLAPLFGIFVLIMLAEPFVLEGVLEIPFRGDVPLMIAAGCLLIIAYLSLGALLQLLARDLATGLGLAGLIASPAFGYAGVGFPTIGMNTFAQTWSAILPLRWYMAVLLGQAARGLPVSDLAVPFAALAGLAVLFAGLALAAHGEPHAQAAGSRRRGLPSRPKREPAPRGIGGAFKAEWRRVLGTRSAFSLLFLAPLVYGIYYPQPYLNQILRKLPIAVVDNDLSDLSRQIVETLDASGALSVVVRARTLAEARTAIDRGQAFAAVEIPPGTERDVLKGITAHIPIYADATYLFIFKSTASGVATAIGTLTSELVSRGARSDGSLVKAKLASSSPADVLLQPIFNPVGGYASYVVPAAFILILQQTLLIGAAMLTGAALAAGGGAFAGVLGRGVAHLTIYLPALALYLIVLPRIYGFSTLGHLPQIFALAAVFLLATSFMGQAVGAWFTRPENATILLLATSLPQFFMAGFAWPREAIPDVALAFGRVFPADSAIDGLVRINQLGAGIWEVAHDWLVLWCLATCLFRARGGLGVRGQERTGACVKPGLQPSLRSLLAAGAVIYSSNRSGSAAPIIGVVRATEVRVEPEVNGQLVSIAVEKGARVHAGDVLARLSAVELTAQLDQARAALASAAANRNNVYAGVRREQVDSLKAAIAKASSRLDYVQAQLTRTSTLARQSFESQQNLDQAETDVAGAQADVEEAQANYDAAVAGPTREERAITDTQVQAASAAVSVLERRLDKMVLRAPADGVVSVIAAEVGENVRAGQPILMVEAMGRQWLSFNVREDHLGGLAMGATVSVSANRRCWRRQIRHHRTSAAGHLRDLAGRAGDRRSRPQHTPPASRSAGVAGRAGARHDRLDRTLTKKQTPTAVSSERLQLRPQPTIHEPRIWFYPAARDCSSCRL